MCLPYLWLKFGLGKKEKSISTHALGSGTVNSGTLVEEPLTGQPATAAIKEASAPTAPRFRLRIPEADAKALRDTLLLEASTSIITVFDVRDGSILLQNSLSKAYFGDQIPEPGAAGNVQTAMAATATTGESQTAARMAIPKAAPSLSSGPSVPSALQCRCAAAGVGDALGGDADLANSPLAHLFSQEPEKLKRMVADVTAPSQSGSGRVWKGVVRVPPWLDARHEVAAVLEDKAAKAAIAAAAAAAAEQRQAVEGATSLGGASAVNPAATAAAATAAAAVDSVEVAAPDDERLHGLKTVGVEPSQHQHSQQPPAQGPVYQTEHHHRHQSDHHHRVRRLTTPPRLSRQQCKWDTQPRPVSAQLLITGLESVNGGAAAASGSYMLNDGATTKDALQRGATGGAAAAVCVSTLNCLPYGDFCLTSSGFIASVALSTAQPSGCRPPSAVMSNNNAMKLQVGRGPSARFTNDKAEEITTEAPRLLKRPSLPPSSSLCHRSSLQFLDAAASGGVPSLYGTGSGTLDASFRAASGSQHLEDALAAGSGPLATSVLAVAVAENPGMVKSLAIKQLSLPTGILPSVISCPLQPYGAYLPNLRTSSAGLLCSKSNPMGVASAVTTTAALTIMPAPLSVIDVEEATPSLVARPFDLRSPELPLPSSQQQQQLQDPQMPPPPCTEILPLPSHQPPSMPPPPPPQQQQQQHWRAVSGISVPSEAHDPPQTRHLHNISLEPMGVRPIDVEANQMMVAGRSSQSSAPGVSADPSAQGSTCPNASCPLQQRNSNAQHRQLRPGASRSHTPPQLSFAVHQKRSRMAGGGSGAAASASPSNPSNGQLIYAINNGDLRSIPYRHGSNACGQALRYSVSSCDGQTGTGVCSYVEECPSGGGGDTSPPWPFSQASYSASTAQLCAMALVHGCPSNSMELVMVGGGGGAAAIAASGSTAPHFGSSAPPGAALAVKRTSRSAGIESPTSSRARCVVPNESLLEGLDHLFDGKAPPPMPESVSDVLAVTAAAGEEASYSVSSPFMQRQKPTAWHADDDQGDTAVATPKGAHLCDDIIAVATTEMSDMDTAAASAKTVALEPNPCSRLSQDGIELAAPRGCSTLMHVTVAAESAAAGVVQELLCKGAAQCRDDAGDFDGDGNGRSGAAAAAAGTVQRAMGLLRATGGGSAGHQANDATIFTARGVATAAGTSLPPPQGARAHADASGEMELGFIATFRQSNLACKVRSQGQVSGSCSSGISDDPGRGSPDAACPLLAGLCAPLPRPCAAATASSTASTCKNLEEQQQSLLQPLLQPLQQPSLWPMDADLSAAQPPAILADEPPALPPPQQATPQLQPSPPPPPPSTQSSWPAGGQQQQQRWHQKEQEQQPDHPRGNPPLPVYLEIPPLSRCCRWHRIIASRAVDPATGRDVIVVMQDDVTGKVLLEHQLGLMFETEHSLLEQLYPNHMLRHLANELVEQQQQQQQLQLQQRQLQQLQQKRLRFKERSRQFSLQRNAPGQNADRAGILGDVISSGSGCGRGAVAVQPSSSYHPHIGQQRKIYDGHSLRLGASPRQLQGRCALATMHQQVTLLFADIQGFTPMCKQVQPRDVMVMLNDLFTRFDALLDMYGVRKVETIGDAYFVAGGLMFNDTDSHAVKTTTAGGHHPSLDHPTKEAANHALNVIEFAKAMLSAAQHVAMPNTGNPVRIRIGIHTGAVLSGLLGTRQARFCLFGGDVTAAARMENTGVPGAVHISEATYRLLPSKARVKWQATEGVEVKGYGHMQTYLWKDES